MVKSIKIVQRFFSKSESVKAKSFQLAQAKQQNLKVEKVEILNAHDLYRKNGWLKNNPFKSLGLPNPDQFIVIVHYKSEIKTKPKSIKQPRVTKSKFSIKSKLKIVKVNVSFETMAPKTVVLYPIVKVLKPKISKRNKKEKPHIFFTHRPNATYRIAA